MARIAYNKGSLNEHREKLKLYRKVLPSLDLKRRQLSMELNGARAECQKVQASVAAFSSAAAELLPMLGEEGIDVADIVRIIDVQIEEEGLLGVRLPRYGGVTTATTPYSYLAKPHWVDNLVVQIEAAAALVAQAEVCRQRVALLERAVKKVTQRVNLFERVLIPDTEQLVRKILIFLSDSERSAVVRSKMFKTRQDRRLQGDNANEKKEVAES